MSYEQAMRWQRKHPTGGKSQYMGFSPESGFWPSGAFLKEDYWPYLEVCEKESIEPLSCEKYYNSLLHKPAWQHR